MGTHCDLRSSPHRTPEGFSDSFFGDAAAVVVAAGSGALTHGEPDSAGVPRSLAAETIALPFNLPERVEEAFARWGDQIAAVILEPYPANAGFILPRPGYLQLLRDLTSQHGALLIFDEVMTGFRLAKGGVQELEGLTPDLTAMGKVIGGGLPVGAFGGRRELMDQLAPDGPVYQAGTLRGNPLAMAAGLTQLRELEKTDAYRRLEGIGQRFEEGLRGVLAAKGLPYRLNRVGSMFCLFFGDTDIPNVDSVQQGDFGAFRKFFHSCLNGGVYLAPSPYETGFLSLAHTEADIDESLEVIEKALGAL